MGDTVEQERAQQLPIAQLKMQIAQTGALMKTSKDVNDEIRKWTSEHPGEQVPSHLLQDWAGRAPDSLGVKSLMKEREDFMKKMELQNASEGLKSQQQGLAIQGNQLAMQSIKAKLENLELDHNSGLVSDADYKAQRQALNDQISSLATAPKSVPPYTAPLSNQPREEVKAAPPVGEKKTVVAPTVPRAYDATNTVAPKPNPLSKAQTSQTQPAPVEYQYVVKQPLPTGEPKDVYNNKVEAAKTRAKNEEDRTNAFLDPYYKANDPYVSNNYYSAIKDLQAIQKDPELQKGYAIIHNLLRREGGPLGVAAQKGLSASLGGYGASFSIPVEAYQQAKLDPKYWSLADRVLGNYNTLASAHAMLDGKSIDDFNKNPSMWSKYAHLGKTPDEAWRSVKDNMYDFAMRQAVGKEMPNIVSRITSQYPNEIAPNTAAFRSQEIKNITKSYDDARDIERKKHQLGKQASQSRP
jgi:hypothetical protein